MKKSTKIILWLFFVFSIISCLVMPFINPVESANGKDLLLYRISGFIIALAFALGAAVELNLLDLKTKFFKTATSQVHVKIWIPVVIVVVLGTLIPSGFMSSGFKEELSTSNTQEADTHEDDRRNVKNEKSEDVAPVESGTEKNTNADSKVEPSVVIDSSEGTNDAHEINDETFDFTDAVYIVNGVEVQFKSINLKWYNGSPDGYEITVDYTAKNNNADEATLKFTSGSKEMRFNNIRAGVAVSDYNSHSAKYDSEVRIAAGGSENRLMLLTAMSQFGDKTINDVEFPAVEMTRVMSDQPIEIDLSFTVIRGDTNEGSTVTFTMNE